MQQSLNIKEIETAIDEYGEIVLSKNKKNNVIIMSMEEYKKNSMKADIIEKLKKSEEDIENGRTRKATEVIKELRTKYGF